MSRLIQIPLLVLLAITLTGCGETTTGGGNTVAVVNMGEVAKGTGIGAQMQNAKNEYEARMQKEINALQINFDTQWKAKQKEFGDKPTEEQKKKLKQFSQGLVYKLNQANTQARRSSNKFQQELAYKFQESVKPVAMEIAKESGYSIVTVDNPNILFFDVENNITELVIERLKQASAAPETDGGAIGTPSAPSFPLPPVTQPANPANPKPATKPALKLPNLGDEETPKTTGETTEPKTSTETPTPTVEEKPKTETPPSPEPKKTTTEPSTEKPASTTEEKPSEKPTKAPEKE